MSKRNVIVVGGGAAGMLAAGRAAELGAEVILLEKMDRPGRKILSSGNGRCNLSNSRDLNDFIPMYGNNGRFLYQAFKCFFSRDLLRLLLHYGVKTTVESDGRIFPASCKASHVVKALEKYIAEQGVRVITGSGVSEIKTHRGRVTCARTESGTEYVAEAVVLAAGGSSYPQTGSTGDGYRMAASLGHSMVKLRPALVPLVVEETAIIRSLQGISLNNVKLTSMACPAVQVEAALVPKNDAGRGISGRKPRPPVIESRRGDIIFTHYGLSGPAVLLMSLAVVDALECGPVSILIDLLPAMEASLLSGALQQQFTAGGNRLVKSVLEAMVPAKIAAIILSNAGVSAGRRASQVTSAERAAISAELKGLRFNIKGTRPLAEAMVTAGGVRLDEVNPRTMESKLIKGFYICGEVLDIDADTGGYNLQAAFSTGYLAGQSAAVPD